MSNLSFREYMNQEERANVPAVERYMDGYESYQKDADKNACLEKYLYYLRDIKEVSLGELQAFIDANYT